MYVKALFLGAFICSYMFFDFLRYGLVVPRVETAKLHKNAENLALNTLSFA